MATPRDVVWSVVTDHELYGTVAPNLSSVAVIDGEREGLVRRCVDTDGNAWTEACHVWEPGRTFGVAVDVPNSEFHRRLFHRFEGYWTVTPVADGVRVTIEFGFDPKYGPLGWFISTYLTYRAGPLVDAIFDGWTAEVVSRLDERPDAVSASTPNELFR